MDIRSGRTLAGDGRCGRPDRRLHSRAMSRRSMISSMTSRTPFIERLHTGRDNGDVRVWLFAIMHNLFVSQGSPTQDTYRRTVDRRSKRRCTRFWTRSRISISRRTTYSDLALSRAFFYRAAPSVSPVHASAMVRGASEREPCEREQGVVTARVASETIVVRGPAVEPRVDRAL
jgi:hypothetical protein